MEPVKVIARYMSGEILKGYTRDFYPDKPRFHLTPTTGTEAREVQIRDLKAVFFVKDFKGNPLYNERRMFSEKDKIPGRKLKVLFADGEIMAGTTLSYDPARLGFFLTPVDTRGNNLRVFVVSSAVKAVR